MTKKPNSTTGVRKAKQLRVVHPAPAPAPAPDLEVTEPVKVFLDAAGVRAVGCHREAIMAIIADTLTADELREAHAAAVKHRDNEVQRWAGNAKAPAGLVDGMRRLYEVPVAVLERVLAGRSVIVSN